MVLAMQGHIPGVSAGDINAARTYADRNRPTLAPAIGMPWDVVKSNFFQKQASGTLYRQERKQPLLQSRTSFFDPKLNRQVEGHKTKNIVC